MKTSYKVHPTSKSTQFMQMNGVPIGLISAPFTVDLTKELQPFNKATANKPANLIMQKQQIVWFNKLREEYDKPWVTIICSSNNYMLARQTATIVFWTHLAYCLNNAEACKNQLPSWIIPSNDFKNNYLEENNSQNKTLLVIDGIYEDMPITKQDKTHDIIQTLCNRPRLVILRGSHPYQYCIDKLGVRPNRIINFSKPAGNQKRSKL